eukprot:g6171.t1
MLSSRAQLLQKEADELLLPSGHELIGGRSTILEATFNFVNVVVGAGIVGLPWVFVQAGFWTALAELFLCCWLTHYSVKMLIETGVEHDIYNYEELVARALGVPGEVVVSLALLAFDYGAMLSYEIILGDAAASVAYELAGYPADPAARPLWVRQACLVVLSCALILPTCLFRDVARLERLSLVSVLTVVAIITVVFYKLFDPAYAAGRLSLFDAPATGQGIFKSFSVVAFSFVCHDSAFLIFNTLRRPTPARWAAVSALSLSAALCICLLLAVPGFLTFGARGSKSTDPRSLAATPRWPSLSLGGGNSLGFGGGRVAAGMATIDMRLTRRSAPNASGTMMLSASHTYRPHMGRRVLRDGPRISFGEEN